MTFSYNKIYHIIKNDSFSLFLVILFAMLSGALMLMEPLSIFLSAGHITRDTPWPWILIEEPVIAVTRYVTIFIVLTTFWRTVGQVFGFEESFYKVLRLYWIEFVAFLLLSVILVMQMASLKNFVLVLPFIIPLVQSAMMVGTYSNNEHGRVNKEIVFLVSVLLIAAGGLLHTLVYDYLVTMLL